MSLSRIHSRLLPKMGKYVGIELPLTFSKFNSRDVVINTRKPKFTTVFDVSHMGIYETNIDIQPTKYNLEKLLHLDLDKLKSNKGKLSIILDDNGRVLDDLIISNIENKKYRLVVNAGEKVNNFFDNFDSENLHKINRSIISLQGDGSQNTLEKIINTPLNDLYFMENKVIELDEFEICRCGYTGEDGFELYLNDKYAEEIYEILVSLAEDCEKTKVQFGGLIERDNLRTEAGLNLAGVEFGDNIDIKFSALNMPFLVDKKYRTIYSKNFDTPITQIRVSSKNPIRKGTIYMDSDKEIGFITSAIKSPNLNMFIGIGYIDKQIYKNTRYEIFIKDRKDKRNYLKVHANLIKPNYYRNSK